jgi:hypothetical protein
MDTGHLASAASALVRAHFELRTGQSNLAQPTGVSYDLRIIGRSLLGFIRAVCFDLLASALGA